jgi:hypothetical protein
MQNDTVNNRKGASPSTDTNSTDSVSLISPGSTLASVTSVSEVSVLGPELRATVLLRLSAAVDWSDHYFLEYNTTEFVRSVMASAALTFKPLFHAVVSFAAFHYSVHHATGNLFDSLESYMQSVSLLAQSCNLTNRIRMQWSSLFYSWVLWTWAEYSHYWIFELEC